jgi:hypothetical protein
MSVSETEEDEPDGHALCAIHALPYWLGDGCACCQEEQADRDYDSTREERKP